MSEKRKEEQGNTRKDKSRLEAFRDSMKRVETFGLYALKSCNYVFLDIENDF